jgi:tetratricopeptide (TPR) repeat protein
MSYSFIPPILIVLSLVGIVVFLMKKAPAVADLSNQLVPNDNPGKLKSNFFQKIAGASLFVVKKMGYFLKLVILKLAQVFFNHRESIRQKRKDKLEMQERILAEKTSEPTAILSEKTEEVFRRREIKLRSAEDEGEPQNEEFAKKTLENEQAEKKDIFEKILIERIAANPKDVEAYERLGEYYFEIENWDYAKECFKQVIKLNPKNKNVKNKMRKLEQLLGDK